MPYTIANIVSGLIHPRVNPWCSAFGRIKPDSVIYTDGHTAYNALDVSEFSHYRINHSKEFNTSHNHINGIENFWNQAKRHMRKYNGIPKQHFELFLKECEWRFNGSTPKQLLEDLKTILKQKYEVAAPFFFILDLLKKLMCCWFHCFQSKWTGSFQF